MSQSILAFVTCGSREEAGKIAETLVSERLAACVNVVPAVESCYRWEGHVQWETEHLLMIKTLSTAVERVRSRVMEVHSYDLPEFIVIQIESGAEAYLKWIADSID